MKTNSLISLLKYSSDITQEKRKAPAAVVGSHSEVNNHIHRKILHVIAMLQALWGHEICESEQLPSENG